MPWSWFFVLSFKPASLLCSFTFIRRFFSSSSLSAIVWYHPSIWGCWCFSSLSWFQLVTHPAWHFSWCARCVDYGNGDSRQPCHTPFSILNQSIVPNRVLTVASWSAYRFLRRQIRWSGIPISLRASPVYYDPHSQRLWHSWWNRPRDVSLEFPCFIYDPATVGNLISGFSFFQHSLNIWKFLVLITLKPSM